MLTKITLTLFALSLSSLAGCTSSEDRSHEPDPAPEVVEERPAAPERTSTMQLGNFSISLAVKDLAASRAFYEKLGFTQFGGDPAQNWLILQNGTTTIGLFQGMFPNNIMTFNPGWDSSAQKLDDYTDVRAIQAKLKEQGITPVTEADPSTTGPASCVIVDPDGNQILLDQHVESPAK